MELYVQESLIEQFNDLLSSQMGLHFPRERWVDLQKAVQSAAPMLGYKNTEDCMRALLLNGLSRQQTEILAASLTVGETYFFRDKKLFEFLETHLLPNLIYSKEKTDRRIRIWSAGCCTGEEPYSLAILLSKLIPHLKDWNVTILGTDINPQFIHKAVHGIYTHWSFRDTPDWIQTRYFRPVSKQSFKIRSHLKKMTVFEYLNLAEDVYPSLINNTNAMDLILCRNVLMYFSPKRIQGVIDKLHDSLLDDACLIVSPSESSQTYFSRFEVVQRDGVIAYRKSTKQAAMKPLEPFKLVEPIQPLQSLEPLKPLEPIEIFSPSPSAQVGSGEGEELRSPEKEKTPLAVQFAMQARSEANQGNLSVALEWVNKAIHEDKCNPSYYHLLAVIQQEQGCLQEAETALKRALYLDPDFVLAYFALGNLAQKQGKAKESSKYFQNALTILSALPAEEILPESEGITAGRLKEIIGGIL